MANDFLEIWQIGQSNLIRKGNTSFYVWSRFLRQIYQYCFGELILIYKIEIIIKTIEIMKYIFVSIRQVFDRVLQICNIFAFPNYAMWALISIFAIKTLRKLSRPKVISIFSTHPLNYCVSIYRNFTRFKLAVFRRMKFEFILLKVI